MTVRVEASIDLNTDPDTAFSAVADLPSQEKWIIATRLYPIEGPVSIPQVGSRMAAFTGLGRSRVSRIGRSRIGRSRIGACRVEFGGRVLAGIGLLVVGAGNVDHGDARLEVDPQISVARVALFLATGGLRLPFFEFVAHARVEQRPKFTHRSHELRLRQGPCANRLRPTVGPKCLSCR